MSAVAPRNAAHLELEMSNLMTKPAKPVAPAHGQRANRTTNGNSGGLWLGRAEAAVTTGAETGSSRNNGDAECDGATTAAARAVPAAAAIGEGGGGGGGAGPGRAGRRCNNRRKRCERNRAGYGKNRQWMAIGTDAGVEA